MSKQLVGIRHSFFEKDRANRAIATLKDAIWGRTLLYGRLNEFVTIQDVEQLLKKQRTDIVSRYELHLTKRMETLNRIEKMRFNDAMPDMIADFKEDINRLRNAFILPEFVPIEAFTFNQKLEGVGIDVKINTKLIDKAIDDVCNVYAETEKELKLLDLANEIRAKINEFKELSGINDTIINSIVDDTVGKADINVNGLYNIFLKL